MKITYPSLTLSGPSKTLFNRETNQEVAEYAKPKH